MGMMAMLQEATNQAALDARKAGAALKVHRYAVAVVVSFSASQCCSSVACLR